MGTPNRPTQNAKQMLIRVYKTLPKYSTFLVQLQKISLQAFQNQAAHAVGHNTRLPTEHELHTPNNSNTFAQHDPGAYIITSGERYLPASAQAGTDFTGDYLHE